VNARRNPGWSRNRRPVWLRPGTSDNQVAADTFTGKYHIPPAEITPRTILDCGANIGLTAADYHAHWPHARIVAVEPDEDNRAVAALNYDGTILPYAVTTHNGYQSLQRDGLAAEAYRLTNQPGPDTVPVACATLAHLIRLHLDGHCDLVKLDIEGEEENVLREHHEWAPLTDTVLVECHEHLTGYGWHDALHDLAAAGYIAVRHTAHPQAVWARKP